MTLAGQVPEDLADFAQLQAEVVLRNNGVRFVEI
jgi:hypothetical protein